MNYTTAKLQQLTIAGTYRVYGYPVTFNQDTDEEGSARSRLRPVRPCLCVQDSPQNPCPCPKKYVWWLSEDSLVAEGISDRKDESGEKLHYYDLRLESTVLVESVRPVPVGALKALGDSLTAEQMLDLTALLDGLYEPQIIFFWRWVRKVWDWIKRHYKRY